MAMRAILFDFGGTLDYPRHWLDRFVAHYRMAGVDIERSELDYAFTMATRQAYACSKTLRNYDLSQLVGFLIDRQFEALAFSTTGPGRQSGKASPWQKTNRLRDQIRDSFVAESALGFAKTRPLLASLLYHFKIGVVSNFYGNLDRVLADAELGRLVTATLDSGLLGFYKPDARIFAASLTKLGIQPDDAIMVGDSINNDCAPARKMGMKTVWLRHLEFNKCAAPSALVDFTIDQLEDLKALEWMAG